MAPPPVNLPLGGDFALNQIGQISLPAANLPRAVHFYHDVLRLPLAFQTDTMAFFMAGGIRLMLALPESPDGGRLQAPRAERGCPAANRSQATERPAGATPSQSGPATFDHPGSILYFQVGEIRAAYQALVERGVHFAQPPQRVAVLSTGELWMAFFRDSENNPLAIMSEQPPAATPAAR